MSDLLSHAHVTLSASQRLLIQRLRGIRPNADAATAGIPRAERVHDVPLTSDQARVWFLGRLFPESAEYNQAVTFRFRECPAPQAFEQATAALMMRHDALRLRIYEVAGEPMQALCDGVAPPLSWHDASQVPIAEAELLCIEIGNRCLRAPFDPEQAPLFRIAVVRLPDAAAVAIAVFHHLVVDGRSVEILAEDFVSLLSGESPPAGSMRFIDYAAWRASQRNDANAAEQLAYWRDRLRGNLPILDLPTDRPRPAQPSRRGHMVPCRIPNAIADGLRRIAESENTTLYVVLLSVYKVFLMRVSGATDILVGAPFLGREHPSVERLVGMFVNTAALRTDLAGNPGFRRLVRRVRETVLGAQDHREAPFEQVVSELKVPRDVRHSPLFQTMFGFGGLPGGGQDGPIMNDIALDSEAAKWDITVFLDEFDNGVEGYLEYSEDLFDESTALRFADIYLRLCAEFAAAPDLRIGRARLLDEEQRRHILQDLNPYERPPDRYTTLTQPFEEQVRRTPDAIALIGESETLTYSELNSAANRLAHELIDRGAKPGRFVAVCMERSFDLMIALYAVAKSGAAYVPLDPDLPDERLAFMLGDVQPMLVLAHAPTRARLTAQGCPVLCVDSESAAWASRPMHDPVCDAPAHRPVHLLYTSGSTGRPKAVVYPVNAALAEIFWLQRSYPSQGQGDANLFITSYGFDVSIWEIFWTLYFGALLVLPKPGEQRDPQRLIALIERHRATTLFLIPGMLDLLLDMLPEGGCSSLRWLFCGGAPISPRLRDRCHARLPQMQLLNCYGPTEAGDVTDMVLPRDPGNPRVPLGRPAANYRLYVLDEELEVCPIGVAGEVFLAGEVGVSHGYHERRALTAERYLPDPYGEPGARMYRTGDLCRYRPDGVLEHLGRIDRQIKLRGMRIEPAEIEAVLCEHPAVVQAHVMLQNHAQFGQRLPAFVVLKPGTVADPRALMTHARRWLPRHMVPAAIVVLPALPLNVNNKIDSSALAAIEWHADTDLAVAYVAPEGPDEEALLSIYRDLLGDHEFGVEHNFFEIGGHSLLIFKLIAACEATFGERPSVADVFTCPTVRELAARLRSGERGRRANLVPLAPQTAKPVVVFVHAAGGSVLPFVEVARALGPGFSIWGMQAADPEDAPSRVSIAELAAGYATEVDAVRGMSPLILVGWSMGGCIAFEMAREWRARGVDVAALLLLDTWVPPSLLGPGDRERALDIVHTLDVLGMEGIATADEAPDADTLARMDAIRDRNVHAFADYRPDSLGLEIDYLRARDPFPDPKIAFPQAMDQETDRGWSAFAHSARVRIVDGDHFSIVGREHSAALAAQIRDIVAQRLVEEEI